MDIAILPPPVTYAQLKSHSSLVTKHSLNHLAGVIDPDYHGKVKVVLYNFGDTSFSIESGDQIAQFLFIRAATPLVQQTQQLSTTIHDQGRFGSTGQNDCVQNQCI